MGIKLFFERLYCSSFSVLQETCCQSCVREQGFSRKIALSSMRWATILSLRLSFLSITRCTVWHTRFVTLSFLQQLLLSNLLPEAHKWSYWLQVKSFFLVGFAGSKAQSNGADTGLWCLSGQGPGWAHGRGHHCIPEVSLGYLSFISVWSMHSDQ